jgi:hypothetical protein
VPNKRLAGRKKISIQKVLHLRAKQIAAREELPMQKVVDLLLAYGLKHVEQVTLHKDNGR